MIPSASVSTRGSGDLPAGVGWGRRGVERVGPPAPRGPGGGAPGGGDALWSGAPPGAKPSLAPRPTPPPPDATPHAPPPPGGTGGAPAPAATTPRSPW